MDFLWEAFGENNSCHLIKWGMVTRSHDRGGLGLVMLKKQIKHFWVNGLRDFLRKKSSFWYVVMKGIYGLHNIDSDSKMVANGSS